MKLTRSRNFPGHVVAILALTLISCLSIHPPVLAANTELSLDDARHLLHRTGLGASAAELNRTTGKTREQAVNQIVDGIRTTPALPLPAWTGRPAPHHWVSGNFSRSERRRFNDLRDREIESLRVWWVRQMIETESPQTERLVMMWHNHFPTAYSDVNFKAITIARQHQLFRQHGMGDLEDLLKQMIRDPALLNYLDNDKSRKQSPNENLARELLELFTLGEGNYSESDIKNAARALTGNSVTPKTDMRFRFKPRIHDNTAKTLFGQTGNFNGDDLIDLILRQPQTARFFARRFWQTFISDIPPTSAELDPLATAFEDSGYNLRTLYRATLMSEAFWSDKYRATIVKSPIALTIGTIRSTGIVPQHWQTLPATLASMGQRLFDPPNVAGWPGGKHWITPSRLLTRLDWLEKFALGCGTPACNDAQTDVPAIGLMTGDQKNAASATGNPMIANPMAARSMTADSITTNSMSASSMNMATETEPSMRSESMRNTDQQTDTQADHAISIRLASEDFNDAAQYELSIYRADEKLWTTGAVAVTGGHDSNKLGRLKMNQSIPWQLVKFNVDTDVSDFDRIDVEFLNDDATNSADRNLFIDQVVFKGERFSAENGTQQSNCPPKQPAYAGRLYCNGTLMLPRAHSVSATPSDKQSHSDGFTASAVYIKPVNQKKLRSLELSLTNVALNDRQWHNISILIKDVTKHKDLLNTRQKKATDSVKEAYALILSNTNCWPDCLEEWPECASISRSEPDKRHLLIPLTGDWKKKQCHAHLLTDSDRTLIHALRHNIERIYYLAIAAVPENRKHLFEYASLWSSTIENISIQYRQTNEKHGRTAPPRFELQPAATADPFVEAVFTHSTPLPEQLTRDQLIQNWNELTSTQPAATLATVLLATAPLAAIDKLSLPEVLTDLSAQLQ